MAYDYRRKYVTGSSALSDYYTPGEPFDEEGYFKATRFHNEETGFVIGTFCPKHGEDIVCKGEVPGFVLGAPYHLVGKVIEDPQWGIQVNIKSCATTTPITKDEVVAFLGSGAIPGIGPVTAKRIYKAFGDQTLSILENHPERLSEISGIGEKNIKKMIRTLPTMLKYQDIIGFFAQFGISTRTINRLIEEYGAKTKEVIQDNPYILCRVRGFAFSRADSIAMKIGISKTHPDRLQAGVLYVLRWACQNRGHTLLPENDLIALAMEKLKTDDIAKVREALETVIAKGILVRDELGIHLKYLYHAEEAIKKALRSSVRDDVLVDIETLDAMAANISNRTGLVLTDEQMNAVHNIFRKKVSVLSGAAGTGKTQSCKMALAIARELGIEICLVAPTGRAAKHLSEVCGAPAYTMHRALSIAVKTEQDDDYISEDTSNAIQTKAQTEAVEKFKAAELVIVDETSMMDTEMASILFKSSRKKHVMLVGDPNQLPSVGPGRVLGDILDSTYAQIHGISTKLTKIFRQTEGSPIIDAAHAVLAGSSPCNTPGVRFIECPNDQVPVKFDEVIVPMIYKKKLGNTDIMIVAPMKKTPYAGVNALNAFLRPKLNAKYRKPDDEKKEFLFQEGDYVMQFKNNYEVDIYNGDIGVVDYVDEKGNVDVIFSDSDDIISYERDEVYDQIQMNYAMSIHKSQGSQADTVVVVLTDSMFTMLSKNLLYTAITRAENNLYLVGSRKAFAMAARNEKDNERLTGLKGI